jgi:Flp pilus assembly pilin Flp
MEEIVKQFIQQENGLETVEYAIVASIIVVSIIAAIVGIGMWVSGRFEILERNLSTP